MNCCLPDLADDDFSEWFSMEEALTVVKKVYTKGYKKNEVDIKAVNEYATKFNEALEKGWKSGGVKIDFESVDEKMLASLRENIWQFSAAKSKEELNQLNALLRDENGKLRSWESFKEEAVKVTADFKGRYMRVEYDMAVNSSYLAARWEDYDDDSVLVYTTAGDDRVRESHEELDGITLPKNHSFWDTYYPPLGWNCRCSTFPTTTNRRTPDDQIPHGVIDNVPPMFRTNIAKEGLVFPKGHPYWKNKVKVKSKDKEIWERERINKEFQIRKIGKGEIREHNSLDKSAKDYKNVKLSAESFATKGKNVEMPPKYSSTKNNKDYAIVYEDLKGTDYWGKCPDLKVGINYYEHEGFESRKPKNALRNMLNRGLKQSSRVIIEDCGVSDRYLKRSIQARISKGKVIDEIWVLKDNELKLFYKNTEAQ